MLSAFFFISLGLLVYTYFVYPIILFVLAKLVGRKPAVRDDFLPPVSMIIAAHNEEAVIEDKLQNSLRLDYPREKLEIIVASDGSSDSTNEIARRYSERGIVLFDYPRGGKVKTLNQAIRQARHEIIAFSDANTMYQPDSLRKLVRYMADERVGAVTGDVRLVNPHASLGQSEGLYFRYERFIQACESELGSVVGVDGAMYAIQRRLHVPPAEQIVCDDFVTALHILRNNHRIVYAAEAIAYEDATTGVREEFRRRVRYTEALMQAFFAREALPRFCQFRLWFMYLSHKLLRWNAPFLLVALLVLNMLLLGPPFWNALFVLQAAFYLLAGIGLLFAGCSLPAFIRVPFYFTLQNVAALTGVCRALFSVPAAAWTSPVRQVAIAANRAALSATSDQRSIDEPSTQSP